eukprot:358183-Chlamydomonas_euryale.AAC.3
MCTRGIYPDGNLAGPLAILQAHWQYLGVWKLMVGSLVVGWRSVVDWLVGWAWAGAAAACVADVARQPQLLWWRVLHAPLHIPRTAR